MSAFYENNPNSKKIAGQPESKKEAKEALDKPAWFMVDTLYYFDSGNRFDVDGYITSKNSWMVRDEKPNIWL